jgi:hypothetical protein
MYSHVRSEESLFPPGVISPCVLILRKLSCPYSMEITIVVEEATSILCTGLTVHVASKSSPT